MDKSLPEGHPSLAPAPKTCSELFTKRPVLVHFKKQAVGLQQKSLLVSLWSKILPTSNLWQLLRLLDINVFPSLFYETSINAQIQYQYDSLNTKQT